MWGCSLLFYLIRPGPGRMARGRAALPRLSPKVLAGRGSTVPAFLLQCSHISYRRDLSDCELRLYFLSLDAAQFSSFWHFVLVLK